MPRRTLPESGASVPRIRLEERGLAGAVRADEAEAVAARDDEVEILDDRLVRRTTCETFCSSATSFPERSPAPTASFTLPMRSRRAARSSRRRSRRRTRPSLRVRRASMPLRIQTSSCAQNLSNLRCATASAASCAGLASPRRRRNCPGRSSSRPRSSSTMRVATRSRNARSWVTTIAAGCLEQQVLRAARCRRCRGGWSARRAAAGRARCAKASASAARLRLAAREVAAWLRVDLEEVEKLRAGVAELARACALR